MWINQIADTLADTRPIIHASQYASMLSGNNVERGWVPGPTLWVEDHRGIELISDSIANGFEYRSLALARDDDILLISRQHDVGFEQYLRDTLKLGSPRILNVTSSRHAGQAICANCLNDLDTLNLIVCVARNAGQLNIVPFRSDGHVWRLASHIAEAAGVTVHVAAPLPPLARVANQKPWFVSIARQLLGTAALPPSWPAYGPAAAAARLARLAVEHKKLVLKTPSSAGSRGNIVFESAQLGGKSLRYVRDLVVDSLASIGWSGPWPLLISVWETDALSSPSVQIWIPESCYGDPVIEGVYEQRLHGKQGVFVGATEAELDSQTRLALEYGGLQLAMLLQRLGYVGRASFDALLISSQEGENTVHWIECNARWGGVSIPMVVLRRMGIQPYTQSILIAQVEPSSVIEEFSHVIDKCEGLLYDRKNNSGILWLTPPDSGRHSLDFIAIAESDDECTSMSDKVNGLIG